MIPALKTAPNTRRQTPLHFALCEEACSFEIDVKRGYNMTMKCNEFCKTKKDAAEVKACMETCKIFEDATKVALVVGACYTECVTNVKDPVWSSASARRRVPVLTRKDQSSSRTTRSAASTNATSAAAWRVAQTLPGSKSARSHAPLALRNLETNPAHAGGVSHYHSPIVLR